MAANQMHSPQKLANLWHCLCVDDSGFSIFKLFQKKLPVLIVTAMNNPLKLARERDAHPMSALRKPFTAQAFLTAVRLLEGQTESHQPRESLPPKERISKKPPGKRESWIGKLFNQPKSKSK